MAFSAILRRSASKAVPLAGRFIVAQDYSCTAAVFSVVKHANLSAEFRREVLFSGRRFSSSRSTSDESLLAVIDYEIKCAQEIEPSQTPEIPEGFPFKIEDNPRQQTITLTRDFNGESITVEVSMPDLITDEDEEDNDDGDDDEGDSQSNVPLVVSVAKKEGPILEFSCTAFPDEITIDSLLIKSPDTNEDPLAYEGPNFSDLDEKLQKGFHKYLEVRGINPSTTNFLYEYMTQKDSRQYMGWLEDLKTFVKA